MGADDGNVLRLYATLKESQLDAEESLVIRKLKDALKLAALFCSKTEASL